MQVARFVADVAHQQGLAARRGGSRDALSERDRKTADHLFAMPQGIADAHVLAPVVVQQDGEQIVRQDLLDNLRDVGQKQVEIQGLRGCGRHLQQVIQQLRPFAEAYRRLASGRYGLAHGLRLMPIRQR